MDNEEQDLTSRSSNSTGWVPKDWRINFGLLATIIWFGFLITYISRNVGLGNFMDLPIEEMGTFLEGAFAFLAFLWLVIGLFIQQSVLSQNNEELRLNNLNSEKQTLAIAATEMNARQETFFKIAEGTRRQLGAIAGMLFISSQGPIGDGPHSAEEISEYWRQFASGDFEIFSRLFLTMYGDKSNEGMAELYYGTEIRRRHSDNFIVGFDRLMKLAKDCDAEFIIQDSLIYSAHGLLSNRLRESHPGHRFPVIAGTNAQTYLHEIFEAQQD